MTPDPPLSKEVMVDARSSEEPDLAADDSENELSGSPEHGLDGEVLKAAWGESQIMLQKLTRAGIFVVIFGSGLTGLAEFFGLWRQGLAVGFFIGSACALVNLRLLAWTFAPYFHTGRGAIRLFIGYSLSFGLLAISAFLIALRPKITIVGFVLGIASPVLFALLSTFWGRTFPFKASNPR